MKDVSGEIEYRGRKYKLVFNLNVMEDLQEKYGSIEAWGKLTEPSENTKEPDIKALKYGFAAMLNEGIDIDNDINGTNQEPLNLRQVGRMISEVGMDAAAKALNKTVVESTKNETKNA